MSGLGFTNIFEYLNNPIPSHSIKTIAHQCNSGVGLILSTEVPDFLAMCLLRAYPK
jgi:hypothetical protein